MSAGTIATPGSAPASRGRSLRYGLATLLAAVCVWIALGRSGPGAEVVERARTACQPGLSIQEGILRIEARDRRFTLVIRSRPGAQIQSSELVFTGDEVEVHARDRLSKSGRVDAFQALAQLSAELASDPSVTGWEAELTWDSSLHLKVRLGPQGRILPWPAAG